MIICFAGEAVNIKFVIESTWEDVDVFALSQDFGKIPPCLLSLYAWSGW